MGRAQGSRQATVSAARRGGPAAHGVLRHEHTCRMCNGRGRSDGWDMEYSGPTDCRPCEGTGRVTDAVSVAELHERRERAIADVAAHGRLSTWSLEQCLHGRMDSDPRTARLIEAWIATEAAAARPDVGSLVSLGLLAPNNFYRTTPDPVHARTEQMLAQDLPALYETALRTAVNDTLNRGECPDPFALRDGAAREAQARFLAQRFAALTDQDKGARPLRALLGAEDHDRYTAALGARRLRRDRSLEDVLGAEDYYQALIACQLESDLLTTSSPDSITAYRLRGHLARLLDAKLDARAAERAPGHHLHELADGIVDGQLAYEQKVTGSTTFKVWTRAAEQHAGSGADAAREFDTTRPGDLQAAAEHAVALKAHRDGHNDGVRQARVDVLSARLDAFRDSVRADGTTGFDALAEQRLLAVSDPGVLDAQAALDLLQDV